MKMIYMYVPYIVKIYILHITITIIEEVLF